MRNRFYGRAVWDIGLGLSCLCYAAILYLGALQVPPPMFDPLGSAAVPKMCAAVIALLAIVILTGAVRKRAAAEATDEVRQRYDLAAGLVALCAAFVAAMEHGVVSFSIAAAAFLFLCGVLLGGREPRNVLISSVLALTLGFGADLVFTEIFYIQLPR